MRKTIGWLIAAVALLVAAAGCGGGGSGAVTAGTLGDGGEGGVYVALGDSFAAGSGATDPAATSYVALVTQALRERFGDGLEVRSSAQGGHTTQDLIDTQLPLALGALRAGDVRLVTITIGGNDLNVLVNDPANAVACIQDVSTPPCPVPEILVGVEERLDDILGQLRDAAPDTAIVIELYPNVFSGTGHQFERPAGQAFGLVNETIARAAARHDVLLADPRDAFEGRGAELTHVLDTPEDDHPNDAGHRAIADAFLAALGLSSTD